MSAFHCTWQYKLGVGPPLRLFVARHRVLRGQHIGQRYAQLYIGWLRPIAAQLSQRTPPKQFRRIPLNRTLHESQVQPSHELWLRAAQLDVRQWRTPVWSDVEPPRWPDSCPLRAPTGTSRNAHCTISCTDVAHPQGVHQASHHGHHSQSPSPQLWTTDGLAAHSMAYSLPGNRLDTQLNRYNCTELVTLVANLSQLLIRIDRKTHTNRFDIESDINWILIGSQLFNWLMIFCLFCLRHSN